MSSYKVKCLVMGDPSIDTRELIAGCLQSSFNRSYKHTIGCDIGTLDIQLPYERVTLSVWDIASSERFRFFRSSFFRGASCAILAFDFTRYSSFNPTLINLITELYTSLGAIPIILIGCNADKLDQHAVPRAEIEQLCERMARVVYLEINSNRERMFSAFETAAELILTRMGMTEEERQLAYEWRKQRLETLTNAIEELNFHINERDEVEILTKRGLFSVSINTGAVSFEPIICITCEQYNCHYTRKPRRKSLCIVSDGQGWSNVELEHNQLLILAKIFAITEENLTAHILNQMQEVETCPRNLCAIEETPVIDLEPLPQPYEPEILIPAEPYIIGHLFEQLQPAEAKTLLRTYQIQFNEGRLPYSVYCHLKEQLTKIISSLT